MKVVLAPVGTRGDFQPLLTLSVGLKRAGHDVLLVSGSNFASEAAAFGVPFHAAGIDVQAFMKERNIDMNPLAAASALIYAGRQEIARQVDILLPLIGGADLVLGAGPQISAPTACERLGIPYRYVAYTPQVFRSALHPPFIFPFNRLPRPLNALLWAAFVGMGRLALLGPLEEKRRSLGLPPIADFMEHFFPANAALLAADTELLPVPADVKLGHPPVGSFHLPDDRVLGRPLEAFLDAGAAPVYVGFGSMPDLHPAQSTRAIVDGIRTAGCRAVISTGWANLGGETSPDVFFAGAVPHGKLFARCAAIVHHGGAGTTAAAMRAGIPQLIVPHAFDQFHFARRVKAAGLGVTSLARPRLTWRTLAEALDATLLDPHCARRAADVGRVVRARDGIANAIAILTDHSFRLPARLPLPLRLPSPSGR